MSHAEDSDKMTQGAINNLKSNVAKSKTKETNYEHDYRVDASGKIVHDSGKLNYAEYANFDPGGDIKGSTKIEIRALRRQPEQVDFLALGERMLLALQGIDLSLDELLRHKKAEVKEKRNLAVLNGLNENEETGSERID
jgi:hypothetical protein